MFSISCYICMFALECHSVCSLYLKPLSRLNPLNKNAYFWRRFREEGFYMKYSDFEGKEHLTLVHQ